MISIAIALAILSPLTWCAVKLAHGLTVHYVVIPIRSGRLRDEV